MTSTSGEYVGPFCAELGISAPFSEITARIADKQLITNGLVMELCDYVGQEKDVPSVLLGLLNVEETFNPGSLRTRVSKTRIEARKMKSDDGYDAWLKEVFHLPRLRAFETQEVG